MKEFARFCNTIKGLIDSHPKMDIDGARKIVCAINDYLYTTHDNIGTIERLDETFDYFSDFHKFWHNHHKEILGCTIDDDKCEKVADALHGVFVNTNGEAFQNVWDVHGLQPEDVCRIRFLTANQDFRGSRGFSDFAELFESDNSIFDEINISEDPQHFITSLKIGTLSQNDKRISYAKNLADFLISKQCTPYKIIDLYDRDVSALRDDIVASKSTGYGNKKADMFIRDMVVLGIWPNVTGFDKINVASDVNTIKVALRTGIIKTEIPLVSSFLDIFCSQYEYIDNMNALAWRKVWEVWTVKYPCDQISSPCLIDYFVYNVIGKQFCKEILSVFRGDNCGHEFKWHSSQNKTCQVCNSQGVRRQPARVIQKYMPCCDKDGYIAIRMTDYVKKLPQDNKINECPFVSICADKKHLMPPKSISIKGKTGWETAYSTHGEGGGGLMA